MRVEEEENHLHQVNGIIIFSFRRISTESKVIVLYKKLRLTLNTIDSGAVDVAAEESSIPLFKAARSQD